MPNSTNLPMNPFTNAPMNPDTGEPLNPGTNERGVSDTNPPLDPATNRNTNAPINVCPPFFMGANVSMYSYVSTSVCSYVSYYNPLFVGPNLPLNEERSIPDDTMAQVISHKRRGISSGETSASSSSTCQLPTLPGGTTPGTLTDELAALFECPVCFEIVLPPIMQCQVGHLVCASCRPKLSCCPTCRGTLGNIRNLAMEKVANNLMFPCKHKSTGCRMSLGLNEKAEHEEICEFRPYSCPCPGASCSWQGQLDKVMVHLQHSHKNITTLNGEDIVFLATEINLAGAVDWVMMQSCFGHHFMLVLEKQEKNDGHTQFFAIVQLIGSRKQAEHFAYRLELNGNRRRLIWEAMPRSSHEGVASAIMASDCLAFDNSIAQHFADNGNLGINVTISLVC